MKRLTQTVTKKVSNAMGRDVVVTLTDWMVEETDIGRPKCHFERNGEYHRYTFTLVDVGKVIREDTAWCGSWYFRANLDVDNLPAA